MNKDEQATFLEFQKRIKETQGSTASSQILAQIVDESQSVRSSATPTPDIQRIQVNENIGTTVFDYKR